VIAKNECLRYFEALKCVYSSPFAAQVNSNNSKLLKLLTEKSGQPVRNFAEAEFLYNILILQKKLELQLPDWASEEVLEQMKQLAITSLAAFTQTSFMRKIRGGINNKLFCEAFFLIPFNILGPLLEQILHKLVEKQAGSSNLKLFVVSGHDLTLVSLLRTLGFTESAWKPDFSASLIIELHKIGQDYQVQVFCF